MLCILWVLISVWWHLSRLRQDSFISPSILLPPQCLQPPIFSCICGFTFYRLSCNWNPTVNSLLRGFFHLVIWTGVFSMSFHGPIAYFFLSIDSIPLSGWTTVCLSITHWRTSWLHQVLTILNKAAINIKKK